VARAVQGQRNLFLYAPVTNASISAIAITRSHAHYTPFHRIVANLQRALLETESDWVRQKIEENGRAPLPGVNGRA